MSEQPEEYTTCRCGAKFTNDAEGKRLYDLHQAWCGKQGKFSNDWGRRSRYGGSGRGKRE